VDFLTYLFTHLALHMRITMAWLMEHPVGLALLVLLEVAWIVGLLVFTRTRTPQ
jgi:hypothetical protein